MRIELKDIVNYVFFIYFFFILLKLCNDFKNFMLFNIFLVGFQQFLIFLFDLDGFGIRFGLIFLMIQIVFSINLIMQGGCFMVLIMVIFCWVRVFKVVRVEFRAGIVLVRSVSYSFLMVLVFFVCLLVIVLLVFIIYRIKYFIDIFLF